MLTKEEIDKLIAEAPKDEKGRPVIPDDVFMENYKLLPQGVVSDAGKYRVKTGYLNPLRKGEARNKEIQSAGGKKSREMYSKRKTWAESIDIFLKMTDEDGVSNQDKIIEAMARRAMDGCVGASEFLRDTVGEKPSENLSLDVMTDGDKELIANLMKRLNDRPGDTTK